MKYISLIVLIILLGIAVWMIGNVLSSDAVGLLLGLLLGMLASIPALLLAVVSNRRADSFVMPPPPPDPLPQPEPVPTMLVILPPAWSKADKPLDPHLIEEMTR